jgi:FkbH-like protein
MAGPAISELLKQLRCEARAGAPAALDRLQHGLLRTPCMPEEWDAVGRFAHKYIPDTTLIWPRYTIRWAGQCTTTWLMHAVTAIALRESILLDANEAPFDNVFQDVVGIAQACVTVPNIYVFLPWLRDLDVTLLSNTEIEQRVADELAFWENIWRQTESTGTRIVQLGFDAIHTGPAGLQLGARNGVAALLRQLNDQTCRRLNHNACFVDLATVAAQQGRAAFYDPRRYAWTKQPFSESGAVARAEAVVAGLRALVMGPKKVLVLDLDNTLWGGIVGEVGPFHVGIGETPDGEAFRHFQKYVKALSQRGVILAVASKNNPADAREPFAMNPAMVLKLDDFAAFEAHWQPKVQSLERIAKYLNLSLDSFVFFDDNPAEREHIRQALPQVAVVEVPDEPAEYIRALEAGMWFETLQLTDEDRRRAGTYQAERRRSEILEQSANVDDYSRSLNMVAQVSFVDETDLPRVAQLLAKTNQFNLTTRRHSAEDVRRLLRDDRAIGLTVRLADRLGDYGLIAVVLAMPDEGDPTSLDVDTWLMSCRVIGRSVEEFTALALLEAARQKRFRRITGRYIATPKNGLVADLYPRLGFQTLPDDETTGRRFVIGTDAKPTWHTFVQAA